MKINGIDYPCTGQPKACEHAETCPIINSGYVEIPSLECVSIAVEIREMLKVLNQQIATAEKLDLEVEIKQNHQHEVPTPKYRVEITQTVKF